jgi:hypothetical protein
MPDAPKMQADIRPTEKHCPFPEILFQQPLE